MLSPMNRRLQGANYILITALKPCYTSPQKGVRIGPSTVDVRKRFDNEPSVWKRSPKEHGRQPCRKGTEFTARRDRLPVEPDARIAFVLVRVRRRLSRVNPFGPNCLCFAVLNNERRILDLYPIDLTSLFSFSEWGRCGNTRLVF